MAQRSLYDLINGEFASGNPNLAVNVANPDAVIARQRFVYDGSGKSVPSSVWTLSSGGTGTVTMDFNGLKLTSSAGDKRIGCGEKAQFSKTGCVNIWSSGQVGEGGSYYGGFVHFVGHYGDGSSSMARNTAHSFINANGHNITTAHNSGAGSTDGADNHVAGDYVRQFTTFKIHQGDGWADLYVNGRLDITRTDTQTTEHMQPFFYRASAAGSLCVRYCEAYNI